MFGDLDDDARLDVDRSGSADADRRETHRLDAGVVERRSQRLGELERHRFRAALPGRVPPRACPSTVASPSVTTAWIFVPPRSSPPRIRVHGSHRTTSSSGLRFARALHSEAVCTSGSRGFAG